ncbi:hypothetical protein ACFWBF_25510 [Streptomyces sp. NPDC060028]|uniref:hypothetical protein n=1 Tax=Streptomyces sp. NPDC060028 TaxID=3347041 RepID=UPI00369C7CCA
MSTHTQASARTRREDVAQPVRRPEEQCDARAAAVPTAARSLVRGPGRMPVAALAFAGFGAAAGLFLTAGKRYACDATTACTKTPYEPGYHDPPWPHWPFVTAAVCAAVAVATWATIVLSRRGARSWSAAITRTRDAGTGVPRRPGGGRSGHAPAGRRGWRR